MCAKFNYMAVVGNSGTGKTTFVKTLLNSLEWDRLYLCDPNRQYADYTMNENAEYISPKELKGALNMIGKRLLLMQKKGVLVIEDLNFTLERLSETMQISVNKAKKIIKLLLENLRKYDVKVIIIMHDIDRDIVAKCDMKIFFQTPLTNYKISQYSKMYSMDMGEVVSMQKFNYLSKNGGDVERGHIEILESHQEIERDKSFMVKQLLANCRSLPEKVLLLRFHLEMKNYEIAKMLNVEINTVEVVVSRLRKRGIPIPDARRSFRLENLAF